MIRKLSPLLVGCAALASLWLVLPSIGAEPKDKGSADSAAQNFAPRRDTAAGGRMQSKHSRKQSCQ